MAYSSIAILALLVHLIINFDVIKSRKKGSKYSIDSYRWFLYSVMFFYVTDALWGVLYEAKHPKAIYLDTVSYYIAMTVAVFLWTRYVINYLNEKNIFISLLAFSGWAYLIIDGCLLIINFFYPVKFYFDQDGVYHACITRYGMLVVQICMFLVTAIYVFIYDAKTKWSKWKDRLRHRTIGAFGIAMTLFVVAQYFYPLLPLYSIGYLLGVCLIHTFVIESEKDDYRRELEAHMSREELQRVELGSARELAYTDSLTGVKNKRAFTEAQESIQIDITAGTLNEFGIVVFDLNGLKMVNDTKGHDAGDVFIKDSCHIICESFKHSPVYRIGGDEFVAFLKGEDYANREKLLNLFDLQMDKNRTTGGIVIASGLEIYRSERADSFTTVFDRADKKMYERKRKLKENS